jgi:hypothetical protein
MKNVQLKSLNNPLIIAYPSNHGLTLRSPALSLVCNFSIHTPCVLEHTTLARDALAILQRERCDFKFVIDAQSRLTGTLSLEQVALQNQLIKTAEGYDINTLSVADVMLPLTGLKAISLSQLQGTTVEKVLSTLSDAGIETCLVLDAQESAHGYISTQRVARTLNIPTKARPPKSLLAMVKGTHSQPLR